VEKNKAGYKSFPYFWSPDINLMNKIYGKDWKQELDRKYGNITPESIEYSKLTTTEKDNLFHIGSYEQSEPAKTLKCTICGGKKFNVGIDNCFTSIKCIECNYEVCVHEG